MAIAVLPYAATKSNTTKKVGTTPYFRHNSNTKKESLT